jgi:moderate conductance mechanosensitive channel
LYFLNLEWQTVAGMLSIAIAILSFFIIRFVIRAKLKDLKGTEKLVGLATATIVLAELVYLGLNFRLFSFALEIITSIGVGMVIFGIAFQHQLKNMVAGMSLFFNKEINVGDIIRIDDEQGTIIEMHLTHTIALTEEGAKILIPNQKFSEDAIVIRQKKSRSL